MCSRVKEGSPGVTWGVAWWASFSAVMVEEVCTKMGGVCSVLVPIPFHNRKQLCELI